ncbi:formiminoglutamase [Actimicrobium sp. GrIS 1.19]|uniref:formimidoylglutamase n=1 Tax=Actimicrobium sp. GrIS 1.19 TaxID=3071708 RepID=UPI002E03C51D|nr:formiminoglutamase [Actimicrobium sp. GrIS 1.19]
MKTPADMSRWNGRIDAEEGVGGMRWHQQMQPVEHTAAPGIVVLGFACDAGVARNHGRTGAREGPQALRAMLANMPALAGQIADAGDVVCMPVDDDDGLEATQQELAQAVAALLAAAHRPIVLGGGHEMAFGTFCGLARSLAGADKPPRIGILNLDAHFDLRLAAQANSGTPFRQIADDCCARGWAFNYCCLGVSRFANTQALFDRAATLGVRTLLDEQMTSSDGAAIAATLASFLERVDHLYFTICLDVLPAALAPGVSAPAARGVGLDVIEPIIDLVAASGKLRVADIAELNPTHDIDQRTARVGARLVARLAAGWNAT